MRRETELMHLGVLRLDTLAASVSRAAAGGTVRRTLRHLATAGVCGGLCGSQLPGSCAKAAKRS